MPEQMEVTEQTLLATASRAQSEIAAAEILHRINLTAVRRQAQELYQQGHRAVVHHKHRADAAEEGLRLLASPATAEALADAIAASRPVLPYQSIAQRDPYGITVAVDGGSVVIDGRPHSPAAALELSAAIARAATEIAKEAGRG